MTKAAGVNMSEFLDTCAIFSEGVLPEWSVQSCWRESGQESWETANRCWCAWWLLAAASDVLKGLELCTTLPFSLIQEQWWFVAGTSVVLQSAGGFWLVLLPGPDFAALMQAKDSSLEPVNSPEGFRARHLSTQVCKHRGLCILFPSKNTRWATSALRCDVHLAVFLLFPNSAGYPSHSWREAVPLSWAVSDLYMLCIGPVSSSDQKECNWSSCHRKPRSIFSPE